MQILALGPKMEQMGGGNFPLDCLGAKEYFLILVTARCQINPTTKPLTF
jgi:hypothetical protein